MIKKTPILATFLIVFTSFSLVQKSTIAQSNFDTHTTECLIAFDGIQYEMRNGDIYNLVQLDDRDGFHLYSKDGESYIFRWEACEVNNEYIALCSVKENQDIELQFSRCGPLDCLENEVFTQMIIIEKKSPSVGKAVCN